MLAVSRIPSRAMMPVAAAGAAAALPAPVAPALPSLSPAATAGATALRPTPTAGITDARQGFERLFDFPDFATGDRFKLDKGSFAPPGIGIKGEARIDQLEPSSADFWIKGGRFGINREAQVVVDQTSPTTARLIAHEKGQAPFPMDMEIVDARRNYLETRPVAGGAPATFAVNDMGQMVIDYTDVRDNGRYHFVLTKQ